MTLTVNGETRTVAEGLTLAQLVEELHLVAGRLACEVNGQIVRRADYPNDPPFRWRHAGNRPNDRWGMTFFETDRMRR
jgi:thiamine biosynthesis protein ThiS